LKKLAELSFPGTEAPFPPFETAIRSNENGKVWVQRPFHRLEMLINRLKMPFQLLTMLKA
jgi:hypothetical protein